MTMHEVLSAVSGALPETRNKLSVESIKYNKQKNHALFHLQSEVLLGEESFQKIKKIISGFFPGVKVSVRISSPALGEAFLENPDQYAFPVNQYIRRHYPSVMAWEKELSWKNIRGQIALELPNQFAVNYFTECDICGELSNVIFDVFKVRVPVQLLSAQENEMLRHLHMENEKERERASLSAMKEEKPHSDSPSEAKKEPAHIFRNGVSGKAVSVSEINDTSGTVVVAGQIVQIEKKEISGGKAVLVVFPLTDFTGTITCKTFLYYRSKSFRGEEENEEPITFQEKQKVEKIISALKPGMGVKLRGIAQYDSFSKEVTLNVKAIDECPLEKRMDCAPEKRIELHLHTQMSNMDAVISAKEAIARAAAWGHEAIAITDHGVTQAFPEAFAEAKKNKIKLIPGMEGYLTDEDEVVSGEASVISLEDPVVVLDFETTGLNIRKDRIIEIGAVKIAEGKVVDSYSAFINPETVLPPEIVELTHITDVMLKDAPTARDVLPDFLKFLGDTPIAAHNAKFDYGILHNELERLGISYQPVVLDTLTLARKLYPELKTHRLSSVCKRLHVILKNAHRAVHDAEATAQCLIRMIEDAKERGCTHLYDLNHVTEGYSLGFSNHIILLAANQKGMENLNHMISDAHLKYFKRRPHIPRAELQRYREGIVVGSACAAGELYEAILDGAAEDKLLKIASFYDYLEIQPIGNNDFLLREGRVESEEALRDINRKIVRLGEKLNLPVVATGDVHFLDPKDSIFRTIIQAGQGYQDCDLQPPLYFHTTEEMLEEFSYLGEAKAHEVVIEAPKLISDKIDPNIRLFPEHPEKKTTFSPYWADAEDAITSMTWGKARELYGDPLPEIVQKRIEKELNSIVGYGFATLYSIANKLVSKSLSDGYIVGSRGSIGSSLVGFLCGITEVNALPPHYRCPQCKYVQFDVDKQYTIGVDLPRKVCPQCGAVLEKDGFDIPFEVFLGFKGDKVPDIDLNFSGEYQATAHAYVKELFGQENVFRAGTIGKLAEKTAFGYVLKYLEENNKTVSDAEKHRLAKGCEGVKRTTGQHPAGMVVLPVGYDICQFTAVQHPADDAESGIITTHYDFRSMHDILVKLDILGHDDPTMLHMLEEITGVKYTDIPLDDPNVMSLFCSTKALDVTPEQIGSNTGTFGVPEFGTGFVRQMLEDTKPTTMQELIRISGLSHGTNVWLGNAKDLIDNKIAPLSQCLCTRDDIMNQLMQMNVPAKMSFDIMESVRKGKGLTEEMTEAMHEHQVPDWFEDSCRKIKYMFPKGHAVAYVTMALRIAWFKVYRPLAYYAAYFTIRGDGFDASTMTLSYAQMKDKIASCRLEAEERSLTQKEEDALTVMEVALEMLARGYSFLPVDLYQSDVHKFIPVGNKQLRVPLIAIGGLGEAAAEVLAKERETPFISLQDLKERGKLSQTLIDLLQNNGCLKEMPETNQVALF